MYNNYYVVPAQAAVAGMVPWWICAPFKVFHSDWTMTVTVQLANGLIFCTAWVDENVRKNFLFVFLCIDARQAQPADVYESTSPDSCQCHLQWY